MGWRAGEVAQQLKACTAVAEDMSPLQAPMADCNSSSRDMPPKVLNTHAQIHTQTCVMYTSIHYYFMRGCFTYMYILSMGMPDHWGPEESVGSPGTRVRDDYKLPCECWESNSRSPGKAASSLNC